MSSLNSKYLEINHKIDKLKTNIKFLINNYTYHNVKDPYDIIKQYESYLNEIQTCYVGFTENCDHFEQVISEAEQLSLFFDQEIKKFIDALNLDNEEIDTVDEDLAFLNDEPSVMEQSNEINSNNLENIHNEPDLDISGMEYMNDSIQATPLYISKNNPASGLATPMVKSNKKKSICRVLLERNYLNE